MINGNDENENVQFEMKKVSIDANARFSAYAKSLFFIRGDINTFSNW